MTDPKSRPQLPSERVSKLADELRPNLKGTALETSEVELRFTCLLAYLDERETQLHPIARAQVVRRTRPDISIQDDDDAHPAPTSSPGEDKHELPSNPVEPETTRGQLQRGLDEVARVLRRPALFVGEHADAVRKALTHDGATAEEWASRYADLANAAAGAVGVLAVNDPAQRMVKERLEGVLAGRTEPKRTPADFSPSELAEAVKALKSDGSPEGGPAEMFWSELGDVALDCYQAVVSERDHAASFATEHSAELTRLKEENARLSGDERRAVQAFDDLARTSNRQLEQVRQDRIDSRKELANEKAAHEVTRRNLTKTAWLLWDARTKAKSKLDAEDWGGRADEWLDVVIPKPTRTEGEQAATPPEPPLCHVIDCRAEACWFYCDTHVPRPPAERPLGEEEL